MWGPLPVTTNTRRDTGSIAGVPRMPSLPPSVPPFVASAVHTGWPVVSSKAKTFGVVWSGAKAKKSPLPAGRVVALQPVAPAGQPAAAGPCSR